MKTRRDFLQAASLAATAAYIGTPGMAQFSFAQLAGETRLFIKAFMRGGADGLHLFPPYGDPFYYLYRPDIALEGPNQGESQAALDMGSDYRAMNPNLWPLMEIWEDNRLLVSPATHYDRNNRSHFDSQRWIGTGTNNNLIDGYLNRYMQVQPVDDEHPIRGATLGQSNRSREMSGAIGTPSINRQSDFNIRNNDFCSGSGCAENRLLELMSENALHPTNLSEAEGTLKESQLLMVETIEEVQGLASYMPNAAARELADDYSGQGAGRGLKLIAQLVKGNIPLEVAAINVDGSWDSHSDQISMDDSAPFTDQNYRYNSRMHVGARDLAMFYRDMQDYMDRIVVLVCTEFGRTVKQNGSVGTDHGHAGAWYAFGGGIQGGFAPDVATISEETLDRGNFLPMQVNYKDIVGEIMVKHLGLDEDLVSTVFPEHSFTDYEFISAGA
ncbi:MAG: DUF1501 domain-containing protein [Pseudomonadota bacterium]